MAKKKIPEVSPEAQAANEAGDARRAKEKTARRGNAEKQARYRESMKEMGYKQVLLWALPSPPEVKERMAASGFRQAVAWEQPDKRERLEGGKVKVSAAIRETSFGAADKSAVVMKALHSAIDSFFHGVNDCPEKNDLCKDFLELLKPLGNPDI